jgi:glycosyltransferase involved in cell wall biosynthesis
MAPQLTESANGIDVRTVILKSEVFPDGEKLGSYSGPDNRFALMSIQSPGAKVGIALTDTFISGTVRRVANMFKALSLQHPSRYHLIVSEELYGWLNRAQYHLDDYPNVHHLKVRSRLDSKKWETESLTFEDVGRYLTLRNFRKQTAHIIKEENIRILQVVLDSVYMFGLHPIPGVVQIASLVSHLRRHYDNTNLMGRVLRFCLGRYDLIDCISPRIYELGLQNGFPPNKMFCAPNSFVNVEQYKPEKKNVNQIVFAARLNDFKNPELYLNAINETHEQCPQAEFHLLGTGPLRERIKRRLHTLGLQCRVHSGFMWDTSRVLNKSSINVHLEEEDNYPNQSLLEGMAAGNAIVATDVGLTRRLAGEDNGIVIPPSDTRALTKAMIWMLEHPGETLKMGKRSREKVLREHTLDSYLKYIEDVYDRASLPLLGKRDPDERT